MIPRELIYEDRKDINDFGIHDESSLNSLIYKWLHGRKEIQPGNNGFKERKLKVFNDAYYVCTMILSIPRCDDCLYYYKKDLTLPSIVLPMVYCYISKFSEKSLTLCTLQTSLETYASEDSVMQKNLDDIKRDTEKWNDPFPISEFNLRNLTPELLASLDWSGITVGFKREKIEIVVRNFAKNENEQKMIGEAIENAARLDEDDFYNPKPCPDDYVDDSPDNNWDSSSEDDGFWTPDYSEAYSLCEQLKQGDVFIGKKREGFVKDESISIAQLKEQIKVLEAEKNQLNETIETLNANLGEIDFAAKIGLELIVELMKKDGANFEKHGNKTVCSKALRMMTGRSQSLCKSIHSEPLSKTNPQHKTKIKELNDLLEKLGMETRL